MHHRIKATAATVGAVGVAAMAAVTIGFDTTSAADPPRPGPIDTPQATTGETVTAQKGAPKEPATLKATPQITGPAPLPAEEQGLPGD